MKVTKEVTKCSECPYFGDRYECGEWTSYCNHPNASKYINFDHAYLHIGSDGVPRDKISGFCPIKGDK